MGNNFNLNSVNDQLNKIEKNSKTNDSKSQKSEEVGGNNIRHSNISDNFTNNKSKDNDNIKDFFLNNKKKSEISESSSNDSPLKNKETNIGKKSNNFNCNSNEEEVEFEINTKNNKQEENNNFKAFLKASMKKCDNAPIITNKEIADEVECSRQMLAEMSKLNIFIGDPNENQNRKVTVNTSENVLPKNKSDEDFIKNNQVPENEANEVKDDIIEKKANDPKVVLDDNDDEEIEFDCRQIIFQNKEEVEMLTQELTNCLGDRVFKAAYKLVYDNVSSVININLIKIDSERILFL